MIRTVTHTDFLLRKIFQSIHGGFRRLAVRKTLVDGYEFFPRLFKIFVSLVRDAEGQVRIREVRAEFLAGPLVLADSLIHMALFQL
jgi:hypothetical protein